MDLFPYFSTMITQYSAVLLILFTYSISSQTTDIIPRIYESPNGTVQFQELAEGRNGFLYALDQNNRIYRLSAEADGKMAASVSPPATWTDVAAPMGSQVLLVSGSAENMSILACSDGACGLSNGDNWSWTRLDHTMGSNNFSQKQQVRGVISSPYRDPYYYIAAQDDGTNAPEESMPVLSVRQLKTQPNSTFFTYRQKHGGQNEAKITVNKIFRSRTPWKVKPVFLDVLPLSPNPFGYLITVQSSSNPERKFESRIGRFCADDKLLTSYSETSIKCVGRNGVYTIAMAGSVLMQGDKGYLAVVFGKSSPNSWEPARNMDTAVCVFGLEEINRKFDEAFRKCKEYTWKNTDPIERQMNRLPWIAGTDAKGQPLRCQYNRASMCTQSSHLNQYIDVKEVLDGRACLDLEGADIRGLQLTNISLPTASGNTEDVVATMNIENSDLKLRALTFSPDQCQSELLSSVPTAVKPRLRNQPHVGLPSSLTNSGRSYVVLSANKIQSFPVGCGMHATCSQCMAASKRMGCGWCDAGHCSAREACDAGWYMDRCNPLVEDYTPKNGSTAGGTEVTITGQLFGSSSARIAVTIAGVPCDVVRKTDDNRIVCKTAASTAQGPVEVSVTDRKERNRDFRFDILGKHHLASPVFRYLAPKIESITPAFGPKTGHTRLTINGRDLLIGNRQEIHVAGIPCRVLSASISAIICDTGASENSQKGAISLLIDGAKVDTTGEAISFEYRDEPVVEEPASPLRMTMSGNNVLTFQGSNLDSFSVPPVLVLRGTTASGAEFSLTKDCQPVNQTTELQCPGISLKERATDPADVVSLTVTFAGSELAGRPTQTFPIQVYADPEIDSWSKEMAAEYTDRHGGQYLIKFSGKRLNSVLTANDYHITVAGASCTVSKLEEDKLECRVQRTVELEEKDSVPVWLGMGDNSPVEWGAAQFILPPSAAPTMSNEPYGKSTRDVTIALVVIGGTLTIAIIAVIAILVRRSRMKRTESPPYSPTWNKDMESGETLLSSLNSNELQNNLLYGRGGRPDVPLTREFIESFRKDNLIIDPMYLEYGRKLGSGSFGTVYEGLLRGDVGEPASDAKRVAIKTIQDLPTPSSLNEFLKEGLVMKDLRHRNVMTLFGICVSSPDGTLTSPGLVMPFMSNGDLHSFVKKHDIELRQILNFAIQIAEGMTYLSAQKIVHRDLAARNCMLDEELNVRIADFGHSRDLYETNLYFNPQSQTPLPYRWIAPECISSSYSTKSDVWSFGVVIWELFEKGERPYGELDAMALLDCLSKGFRLQQPVKCPEDVYKLMCQCWNNVPDGRPEFQNLCVNLRAIQNSLQLNGPPRYQNIYSLSPKPEDVEYLNGEYFSS